jgi:hypothetical protein
VGFFCARVTFVTEEPRYTLSEARKLLHDQQCAYGRYAWFFDDKDPLASSYLFCEQCGSLWALERIEELPRPKEDYSVRALRY